MEIYIINGPNLNLLGKRETSIYGKTNFEDYFTTLKGQYPNVSLHYFQSNHEGAILDKIHEIGFNVAGVILNAGALSHTSYAIPDAIKAVESPFVEVHISNTHKRETFRHVSTLSAVCDGTICGLGLKGYELALEYLIGIGNNS